MNRQVLLNLSEEELLDRREDLQAWAEGQLKKYALDPEKTPCVVYWESKPNKKEKAKGLEVNSYTVCNGYNYLTGEHQYLKEICGSRRSQNFIDTFGENAIMFFPRKKAYYNTSKLYVKKIDNDALMIQVIYFNARKPFKNEYGVKSLFSDFNGYAIIITQDKDVLVYDGSFYKDYIHKRDVDVHTSELLSSNRWLMPDISDSWFNDELEGAYDKSYEEMLEKEMTGNLRTAYVLESTRIVDLRTMYCLKDFLCYKDPKLKDTSRQKKIDKLNQGIHEINPDNFTKLSGSCSEYSGFKRLSAYMTRENDDIVIRYFFNDSSVPTELLRLYITQKGFVGAKRDFYNNWVAVNATRNASAWAAGSFFMEKDMFDKPMKNIIYYMKDYIMDKFYNNPDPENTDSTTIGSLIYSLLRYPILESAIKVGIKLGDSPRYGSTYLSTLEALVGGVNEKENNLNKALGLNKHQMNYLINNPGSRLIRDLKSILTTDRFSRYGYYYYGSDRPKFVSISDMDNDTFDHMISTLQKLSVIATKNKVSYGAISDNDSYRSDITTSKVEDIDPKSIKNTSGDVHDILCMIKYVYGVETVFSEGVFNTIKTLSEKHYEMLLRNREELNRTGYFMTLSYGDKPYGVYIDYLRMAADINDRNIAPAKMSSWEELNDAHDSLIVLANQKKYEHEAKMFDELKKAWKKYTMENDEYAVIYPNTPSDIVVEGRSLHHCVASFVKSVAVGDTTILFLRNKKDINKSLLTIEVKDGKVRQAHGFANCSIRDLEYANPGIIEFFQNWTKKKKLEANHIDSALCVAR